MDAQFEWSTTGQVVELCNQIELYMTAIIEAYVEPRADREEFFRAYVLNSAIVSFSGKMKIVFAVNKNLKLVKIDKNVFHRVMSLRNAFAHNDLISGIQVDKTTDSTEPNVVVLESIRGDGSMEIITRDDAYQEFKNAYEKVETSLREMLGKLRD